MNTNPIVSIIINNFNYGRFLADAIDSAINQTYPGIEIIVVDDGSTDESRDIIASYGNKIMPVLKQNKGQASCFNEGFRISKGDIILFLDADDYLVPATVERTVEVMRDGKAVKTHWPLWKIHAQNNQVSQTIPDSNLAEGDLRDQLIRNGPGHAGGPPNSPPTSGNAWSRWFLEKVLPMPEPPFKGGADGYLFVLAPLYGVIRRITEPLGFYRIHGLNNTLKPDYMTAFFDRYEHFCEALSYHLSLQGIDKPSSEWPRDHWYHRIHEDMHQVAALVPPSETLILADDNQWMTEDRMLGRPRLHFTEKNGMYWGPPVTDQAAIAELEEDRKKGASYLVFTWPVFWWLDYYKGFQHHLSANYNCILRDDRLMVFNLKEQIA